MSSNKSSKGANKKENVSLIVTIAVALLAIAAVVVLIVIMNNGKKSEGGASQVTVQPFRPTAEFEQECEYEAHDLVSAGYEILRLFVLEGLPHLDEPYGNAPEDGVYTVDTEAEKKYQSFEDVEKLVKSVYAEKTAEDILHNIDGNGFEVYKNRKVYVDAVYSGEPAEGESRPLYTEKMALGINENFKADNSRAEIWKDCSLAVLPKSESECEITVYLGGVSQSDDLSAVDENRVIRTKMTKTDGKWLLEDFLR